MSRLERVFLVEGITDPNKKENRLDTIPLESVKRLMSDYQHNDHWLTRALPELSGFASQYNIQFNLNTDIGRLVLCDYPHKLVIASPLDPNNLTGSLDVKTGTFAKSEEFIVNQLSQSIEKAKKLGIHKILGIYGQLSFESNEQITQVEKDLRYIMESSSKYTDAVVTSGSRLGVGGIGHSIAKEKNLLTVGIIPETVVFKTDPSNFDLLLVQGEDWGDGSYAFGGIADKILFMGGGYWSYLEYKYSKHFNKKSKLYKDKNLRYSAEFINDPSTQVDFETVLEKIKENFIE